MRDTTPARPTAEVTRLMIDAVQDYAIFMLDPGGHIQTWNPGAQKLKGYRPDEIVGKHFSIFYTEPDLKRDHPAAELRLAREQGRYEEEGWRVRKDGTLFWANVVITAVFDDQHRHVGFVKVTRDFSERRAAEEKLRQSEERFRLLVDSVRDYAIYMLDPKGHVASWNSGAERLKGYKADEILGRHFSLFYPEEARRTGHPAEELHIAATAGRYEEEGWRVRKDGTRLWANVVLTPIRDAHGALVGFAKVTRDLTERRLLEQQREEAVRRLQRSNKDLQEFAMVASHDLQEPLRKIQLFTERLQEDFTQQLPAEAQDYLARMRKAADRGRSLIQGLLAYSRLTTRAQPPVPTALREVADEVLQDLEARTTSVGGRIEVGELPVVEADPLQMRQLFQNLIGNALKFHREGVPPVVTVASEAAPAQRPGEPPRWTITVRDNGIGFDEKYLDRIFKLFQRLHERGSYEGSGMGLAICRKIVERHGGSITARSALGQGTTFVLELPARQPKEKQEEATR